MVYKAVIFDMGGVLTKSVMELFAASDERLGVPAGSYLNVVIALTATIKELQAQNERGEILASKYFKLCADALPEDVSTKSGVTTIEKLQNMFTWDQLAVFDKNPESFVRPEMIAFVKHLTEMGIKTALLTNNFYIDDTKTRSMIVCPLDIFDVVVESCRCGMRKPERSIFEHTLKKLGVEASEAIFLDDMKNMVEGGENARIKSIQVTDGPTAIKQVKKLLGLHGDFS